MVRFVASADWQLGMTAHFLEPESRALYQQARFDAIRRVGVVAREQDCDFVVVGGDVFESNHLHRRVLARAFEALAAVPVPVYLLPGNHDPLDATSIFRSEVFLRDCPAHVHVLDSGTPLRPVAGVELLGAPWFTKRPLTDLVAAACELLSADPDTVRIVVGHGAVDTLNPNAADPASISLAGLRSAIDAGCVQVAILGDRHSTTEVAERIWYPGTPEVTDRDELDPGNVLVVDVGHEHCEVTSVPVGRWRFEVVERDLTGAEDVAELSTWLRAQPDKERTALWLVLRGTLRLQDKVALDTVIEHAEDVYAGVSIWQRHTDLSVRPDDHDLDTLGLTGFAADAAAELVGSAAASDTAQDALALMYRLAGGGR